MLDSSNTNKIDLWFARYRICYYFSSVIEIDRDFKEKWLIFKIGVFLWVKTLLELSVCYLYIYIFSNVIMRNFGHYWKSWPWYKNLFYISFVLFVRLYTVYFVYILFLYRFSQVSSRDVRVFVTVDWFQWFCWWILLLCFFFVRFFISNTSFKLFENEDTC